MSALPFALAQLRADVSNFALLHYSGCDGFLVTAKNSGTHWLKYMLSCAIAAQYGVAPPERTNGPESDTIIGHPRRPRRYAQLPRIGSSHNLPSRAFVLPVLRDVLPTRPTVILVRDIRDAMLSNYLKWRQQYGVDLSTYVRGDPFGRRYVADVWWYVHFFNVWGSFARVHADKALVVRYEDLRQDPARWVDLAARRLGVRLSEDALAAGIAHQDREAIRSRLEARAQEVVPDAQTRSAVAFSAEDDALLQVTLRRHLRHDFGYGYLSG